MKRILGQIKIKNYGRAKAARFILMLALLILSTFASVNAQGAQTLSNLPPVNVNDSNFSLVVCDGPVLPKNVPEPPNYRPCDFNAVMRQVQHIINIAIVAGILLAVGLLCYAGLLFISGEPGKIKQARDLFPKIFGGFIMMLSAWFIVYELIRWLTGNSGFSSLLGTP